MKEIDNENTPKSRQDKILKTMVMVVTYGKVEETRINI